MCYNSCPYAGSFSGECSNPLKNSKNLDAYCNEDIECKDCGCAIAEDENQGDTNLCPDCFEAWEMTECKACKGYFEKMEIEDGLCPDCDEKSINAAIDNYTELKIMKWNL
jgi:hypothetical protein